MLDTPYQGAESSRLFNIDKGKNRPITKMMTTSGRVEEKSHQLLHKSGKPNHSNIFGGISSPKSNIVKPMS